MAYIEHPRTGSTVLNRFRTFRWATSRLTPQCSGTTKSPAVRIEAGTLSMEAVRDVGSERAYQDYSGPAPLGGASRRWSFEIADAAAWTPR